MATKKNTAQLTPQEYSKLRGYTNCNYVNRVLAGTKTGDLPGVLQVTTFGRFRVLTVEADSTGKPLVPKLAPEQKKLNGKVSAALKAL